MQEDNLQCSARSQMIFSCQMGKTLSSARIINTWTFNRLTPNGNEGVGVQMDYLECTYETKYYIIDKVNGQINAIHDEQSRAYTEFKGRFSPFDLEELEMKVCRLADRNKYEDDLPEPQDALQAQDSNSNLGSHNSEEMTGMGFDPNNYRPIPPVGNMQLHNKEQHYQHLH